MCRIWRVCSHAFFLAAVSVGHQTRKREPQTKRVARNRGDAPQSLGAFSRKSLSTREKRMGRYTRNKSVFYNATFSSLCKPICVLCALCWLLTPVGVEAQRRSVTLNSVSATVLLTIPINSSHPDIDVDVVSSGGSDVRMILSGNGAKSPVIRVPLLVRSNVGFRISASADSKSAVLTQLSVIDVRATGKQVSPETIRNLEIPQRFDMRGLKDKDSSEKESSILDVSYPFLLLSGPRVSLGCTLASPNNALQITVLIHLKPHRGPVQLTFVATAGSLTP